MDSRTALLPETQLKLSTESVFTIRGEAGRGGSCIVYDGTYRTNAGDLKSVRIRECYPIGIALIREENGSLICPPDAEDRFKKAKEQMFTDFRNCNSLFYADPVSDSISSTLNIYHANNTIYTVVLFSRENILDLTSLPTLYSCVSAVRKAACAISCIHEAGYLYLDIKPENIALIPGTTPRIQLFDFDSLFPLSKLRSGSASDGRISFTRGFASMELRLGRLDQLGYYTDIYGIGALLFYLLFGRTPEAPDCSSRAIFDYGSMRFNSTDYPDRLFILLDLFFRKSLAGFPPDRFQKMTEAISLLEEIEKVSDPVRPFLISTPVSVPSFFIGREKESIELEKYCADPSINLLIISGMGGIGKSTFVKKFLSLHWQDWDSIICLYYRNSLHSTFLDDESLRIHNTERLPEESEEEYYERKMKRFREIVRRDRVLLVIDNYPDPRGPELTELTEIGCRIILITRHSTGTLNLPVLKLEALEDPTALQKLFIHYLGRPALPEEADAAAAIIRSVSGHTLAVELFARQISNSFLSISEALSLLKRHGLMHAFDEKVDYLRDGIISYDSLDRIITHLFATDHLTGQQKAILKITALFPAPGIRARELMRLLKTNCTDTIHSLVTAGWITQDGVNIFLHPLILNVIKEIEWDETSKNGVLRLTRTLYDDIISESHKEEILIGPGGIPLPDDPENWITDPMKLFHSVQTAMCVENSLRGDKTISSLKAFRRLKYAAVINLPRYEDENILLLGRELLDDPEYLEPENVMEIFEVMEKAYLERRDYGAAEDLIRESERFAIDDRTKAEYHTLQARLYDYLFQPALISELLEATDAAIRYARLAPHPIRKHLLAEHLLGKINLLCRIRWEDRDEIMKLFEEVGDIAQNECLPYSEIRYGFFIASAFYAAEIEADRDKTDILLRYTRHIAEKLYPTGLDYIDNMIIPPAIMYLDMEEFEKAEQELLKGTRICDEYEDIAAYIRKKHDLHQCLLDVFLGSGDYDKAEKMIHILDTECCENDLADTVQPEVRQFFKDRKKSGELP